MEKVKHPWINSSNPKNGTSVLVCILSFGSIYVICFDSYTLPSNNDRTVLYFYPGAFSQGCTLEARNFQRDMDQYRALNAQIVGVSVDPPEKNAQFCSAEGLDFYMLSDRGGAVSRLYGSALSVPGFGTFSNRQTYVIDPKGNLRWVFTDVESRIPRHSSEVLAKLNELTGTTTTTSSTLAT